MQQHSKARSSNVWIYKIKHFQNAMFAVFFTPFSCPFTPFSCPFIPFSCPFTPLVLGWTLPRVDGRVTRGKTPRFQQNIFHIWEFSYPNICSCKKIGRLAPQGVASCPRHGARRPIFFSWTYIGINKFSDVKNNFF